VFKVDRSLRGIFMSCGSELSEIRVRETRVSAFASISQFEEGFFLVLPSKYRHIISMRQRLLPSKSLAILYLSYQWTLHSRGVKNRLAQSLLRLALAALFSGTEQCCYRTV
jgi:hypothetical protein